MERKNILLVEDDQIDVMMVQRALKELNVTNRLDVVQNGEEALEFLIDKGNGVPCIILLDLNMPKMNGIEFMKTARREGLLNKTPVIVLTKSQEEQDKVESFKLGVSGYMVKPVDYHQFVEVIRAISLYWTLSELPG